MPVIYRGPHPDKNYTIQDFRAQGIAVRILAKWHHYAIRIPHIRVIFRSNGLCGEIRTTCEGNNLAVDFAWGWHTNENICLTTECKSMQEAKSILYMAFQGKGFVIPKEITNNDWSKAHWEYPINKQIQNHYHDTGK